MGGRLLLALLVIAAPISPAASYGAPGATFKSTKNLAALEECLTLKLSQVGEVAAVNIDGNAKTLVLRGVPDGPMMIDIDPPAVTVTTKVVQGTRKLIKACL